MFSKIRRWLIPAVLPFLLLFFISGCSSVPTNSLGADGTASSVIYMSDTQSDPSAIYDYSDFAALLRSAHETAGDADSLIIAGDLVNVSDDSAEWDAFFDAGGTLLDEYSVYPAVGNHTSDADIFTEKFNTPANGPAEYAHTFYSFDHGAIHFVILDSMTMGSSEPDVVDTVSQWLAADLENTDATWIVAVTHHPFYPFSGNVKNEARGETMRTYYLPVLEDGGVDILLCGHEHMYCRTVPLADGLPSDDGLVQIMSVSGGKHYDFPESDLMTFALPDTSVYTVITGTRETLTFETYTADGTLVDTYSQTATAESESNG